MEAQLRELGQGHLFDGLNAEQTTALCDQATELDGQLPGGLKGYLDSARSLLRDSAEGKNPFDGFTPAVPAGEKLQLGTPQFSEMEEKGLEAVANAAFVLVAGGLGERLGYNGIKVSLPLYIAEREMCFLEHYIGHIQQLGSASGKALPLAIMTSDDTHQMTEDLLRKNNFFGMAQDQITIVKQNKVPALIDSTGKFACKNGVIETKPHGHGDVHTLLHQSGLAKKWKQSGVQWICFFQDTNGVIFRALPAVLGVSMQNDFQVNSVCVPRTPGEAVGGICKLEHADGRAYTVNVEYNQLGPLLSTTDAFKDGDVADPSTGNSPFPGNINCLVFAVDRYVTTLESTGGKVKEFVNPKYTDDTKTAFKSPTRLECMMQDFPLLLPPEAKVGFTEIDPRIVCFSPVKNNIQDAAAKSKKDLPPECAGTAERDAMKLNAMLLRHAGVDIPQEGPSGKFADIELQFPPMVILLPSFATCYSQVVKKLKGAAIKITSRSSVVLSGDISITGNLEVDGALVVKAAPGAKVEIKNLKVANEGWKMEATDSQEDEMLRMRGYQVTKLETAEFIFDQSGVIDQ